jgi:hypothetical protein
MDEHRIPKRLLEMKSGRRPRADHAYSGQTKLRVVERSE